MCSPSRDDPANSEPFKIHKLTFLRRLSSMVGVRRSGRCFGGVLGSTGAALPSLSLSTYQH